MTSTNTPGSVDKRWSWAKRGDMSSQNRMHTVRNHSLDETIHGQSGEALNMQYPRIACESEVWQSKQSYLSVLALNPLIGIIPLIWLVSTELVTLKSRRNYWLSAWRQYYSLFPRIPYSSPNGSSSSVLSVVKDGPVLAPLCKEQRLSDHNSRLSDPIYGIIINESATGQLYHSLEKSFQRLFKVHGNNGIENDAWWPKQICTLWDGAHGSLLGGIAGIETFGAYSIVISGSHSYDNNDLSKTVRYCGSGSPNSDRPLTTKQGSSHKFPSLASHTCYPLSQM